MEILCRAKRPGEAQRKNGIWLDASLTPIIAGFCR